MSKYNESICLSDDLEQLSLAYANRSQCFLKLQMYDRCLDDIRLAKEAGYPINLISKLENREIECKKHLDLRSVLPSSVPILSIEPHKQIPQMGSVLQIESDNLYGRLVKAKCDIKIGETLVVEDAYIRIVNDDGSNECTSCGKRKANFIPCEHCADAMFCNKLCAKNRFHDIECDIVFGTMEYIDWLAFTLRSVVMGIESFETVAEMMEFVKTCISTDLGEITESFESTKLKYRAFIKLTSSVSYQIIADSLKIAYFTFHAIMNSTKLAKKFQQSAEQRFLVHLIIHHYIILRKNSFGYEKYGADVLELSLIASHFNHSCLPNVAKLSKENLSVCKTILPIKCNEQLFVCYIADEVFNMTEKQRNNHLETVYEFRCKCQLCSYGPLQAHSLESDPSFMFVVANVKKNNFDVKSIKQHCIKFLDQYSSKFGSQEVHYIADILTAMFSKEFNA